MLQISKRYSNQNIQIFSSLLNRGLQIWYQSYESADAIENFIPAQLYESTHMEYQYFLQHPQFLTKGKIVLPDLNFEVYFRSIKMFKGYVKVLETIVEEGNFMSNQTKSRACAVWLSSLGLNF